MPVAMNKNTRITAMALIAVFLLIAAVLIARDFIEKRGETLDCGKGDMRRAIDLRDFTTRYWAYSVEFEASIVNRGKLATRLEPLQLQQLSEAMQQGREFRQFVVAGYNGCAITKTQYADYGTQFQVLDGLAQQISTLAAQPSVDSARLAELVHQYIKQSLALGKGTP